MAENGFANDTVANYGIVVAMAAASYTILQIVIVRSHGSDLRLTSSSEIGRRNSPSAPT